MLFCFVFLEFLSVPFPSGYLLLKWNWQIGEYCISVMSSCSCLPSLENSSCKAFVMFYFPERGAVFSLEHQLQQLSFFFSVALSIFQKCQGSSFPSVYTISYHSMRDPGKRSTAGCTCAPNGNRYLLTTLESILRRAISAHMYLSFQEPGIYSPKLFWNLPTSLTIFMHAIFHYY